MGAPKGNKNAFKHGLFGDPSKKEEGAGMSQMPQDDLRSEFNMMRVAVKNAFDIQAQLAEQVKSDLLAHKPCDVEGLAKITNSLALGMTALCNLARTQALLNRTDESLNNAFEEGLNSLPIFIDEPYQIECEADAEDLEEIMVE